MGKTVCRFPVKGISVWSLWIANFWSLFYEICVENQWGHITLRFWLRTHISGPSLIGNIIWNRIRICFPNLILWTLCGKADERETESIILILVFVLSSFLSNLNLSWKFELTIFPFSLSKVSSLFCYYY